MNMLNNKTILITGGTGSFGSSFIKKISKNKKIKKIIVLSRDEEKIDRQRREYNQENIDFILGDIRNQNVLNSVTKDVDYIFHAAALKQVPSCEFFPMEAIKTNIIGTENLINASIKNRVKKIVFLSTDKSVYPINAMGMTKALMEKLVLSKAREEKSIKLIITRYGNVLGTRGSIVPNVIERVKKKQKIFITHEDMTRFVMTMDEAIDLVIYALENGKNGDIYIKKCKSSKITNLIKCVLKILKKENYKIDKIGIRHGEKIHETLISKEEMANTLNKGNYYKIENDFRNLNYKPYYSKGNKLINKLQTYSSNNEKFYNEKDLLKTIKKNVFNN